MTHQQLLTTIIRAAESEWSVDRLTIEKARTEQAIRIRTQIAIIAFSTGCKPHHLHQAFAAPLRQYGREKVSRRHTALLKITEYTQHWEVLLAALRGTLGYFEVETLHQQEVYHA